MTDTLAVDRKLREIARDVAKLSAKANPPGYYTGDSFEPHGWVVDAVEAGIRRGIGMTITRELEAEVVTPTEAIARAMKDDLAIPSPVRAVPTPKEWSTIESVGRVMRCLGTESCTPAPLEPLLNAIFDEVHRVYLTRDAFHSVLDARAPVKVTPMKPETEAQTKARDAGAAFAGAWNHKVETANARDIGVQDELNRVEKVMQRAAMYVDDLPKMMTYETRWFRALVRVLLEECVPRSRPMQSVGGALAEIRDTYAKNGLTFTDARQFEAKCILEAVGRLVGL